MAASANAGLGALEALRGDPKENASPDRWITCNMEYGRFYKVPRESNQSKRSETAEKQGQRPQTVPNLNLDALHEKCEKKWEALAEQLEECKSEVEHLRLQKRPKPGDDNSPRRGSPRCYHYSIADTTGTEEESPVTTSRDRGGTSSSYDDPGESYHHDCCRYDPLEINRKKKYSGRKSQPRSQSQSPQRIFNICIRGTPSPLEEEDDKCDRCKMLDRCEAALSSAAPSPRSSPRSRSSPRPHSSPGTPSPRPSPGPKRSKKRWRKKFQPPATATPSESTIHPATSKYNYYKYYGFAGHGAKTSWGHNYPLGLAPPYSVKAPPDL